MLCIGVNDPGSLSVIPGPDRESIILLCVEFRMTVIVFDAFCNKNALLIRRQMCQVAGCKQYCQT